MSPETTTNTTKICPTCGTRLNINATRCSVCGSTLSPSVAVASTKAVQGPRIPAVTLSLPVVIGLAILLVVIGAGTVYAVLQSINPQVEGISASITDTPTPTSSATITPTLEPSPTGTPEPTWTLPPPVEYTVNQGDTCLSIAFVYDVSVQSIIQLNGLSSECILSPGQKLQIPKPTPTPSPEPTKTLDPTQQAQADCQTLNYIVKENDTLGAVAANYAVSKEAIIAYTGLTNENLWVGQMLIIPLCEQSLEPPTATPIPPFPAPNLLLPADGTSFKAPDIITLQWASVGELRQNEAYAVTVIDITDGNQRKLVEYVTDTKFIVPESFRPAATNPHIFYWTVLPVRQTGTDKETGLPVWEPAGDVSAQRSFSWTGDGSSAPVSTPGS